MPKIKRLTNPNKLVEDKANFFADWFDYYTSNVGLSPQFELENPLSLVDKIIYQIENNSVNYLYLYLKNYFNHDYFCNTPYLSSFSTYPPVREKIDTFYRLSKLGEFKDWFNRNTDLLPMLKLLRNDLHENMFESSLSQIISYLKCSHSATEHIDDIKSCVKIFVTEYILRGRSRDDLREVFNSILSKDITMFPFPLEVKTNTEREEFIKNRGLDEQFRGLGNLLNRTPNSWTFYLKVYGTALDKRFKFTYDKVTFFGKHHRMFDNPRKEGFSFFRDRSKFFIASVEVSYFSHKIALEEAREKVKKELSHLCLKFERDLIIDTTNNYLTSGDGVNFYEAWSTDRFHKKIPGEIIGQLKNTPFHFLSDCENDAKNHLLKFEHILLNAIRQNSMPDYWHYLETLLQFGNDDRKMEKIVETISAVVVTEEKN